MLLESEWELDSAVLDSQSWPDGVWMGKCRRSTTTGQGRLNCSRGSSEVYEDRSYSVRRKKDRKEDNCQSHWREICSHHGLLFQGLYRSRLEVSTNLATKKYILQVFTSDLPQSQFPVVFWSTIAEETLFAEDKESHFGEHDSNWVLRRRKRFGIF